MLRSSRHHEGMPSKIDVSLLERRGRQLGRDTYLVHPATIELVFAGVTLSVYSAIEELYCSRLERGIGSVWRIMVALARQAGMAPLAYEAVWAICMHLKDRRARETAVTMEYLPTTWWITCSLFRQTEATTSHTLICAIDLASSHILAFRLAGAQCASLHQGLVLYDAIVLHRRPAREGAAGLTWCLPQDLLVDEGVLPELQKWCGRMGVRLHERRETLSQVQAVFQGWSKELARRALPEEKLAIAFDSYLHKAYGYSPLRTREQHERAFAHLVGYGRDPVWQCPSIRALLPHHPAHIAEDGTISYDGLHYSDDLLAFWPDSQVQICRSEQTEACIWVQFEGDMLCQAMARELRRSDGSYRQHRPRR